MARKRNIRLLVEYDGTRLHGWQIQKDRPTVQGELQKAAGRVAGKPLSILGSGRTDAGVHAEGQVANFHTACPLPVGKWPEALNAHLPPDIAVRSAEEAPLDFHAQYSATSKVYRYRILNRRERSALERDRSHLVKGPLDAAAMQAAAGSWVGTHDFRSFGSDMSKKEQTVRTIFSFTVERRGDRVDFLVHGDGFLYNQVRAMVGTLLPIGLGRQPVARAGEVLRALDRKQAGVTLPGKGLTLVEVRYDGIPRRRPQPKLLPSAGADEEE
jgi:tRNA pseudouridine38-40 synthase